MLCQPGQQWDQQQGSPASAADSDKAIAQLRVHQPLDHAQLQVRVEHAGSLCNKGKLADWSHCNSCCVLVVQVAGKDVKRGCCHVVLAQQQSCNSDRATSQGCLVSCSSLAGRWRKSPCSRGPVYASIYAGVLLSVVGTSAALLKAAAAAAWVA